MTLIVAENSDIKETTMHTFYLKTRLTTYNDNPCHGQSMGCLQDKKDLFIAAESCEQCNTAPFS